MLYDGRGAALGSLFHLNARGEGVFELVQMGNHEDLGEVVLDQIDGLDQALATLEVLRTKALVNDQSLKAGTFALGQHLGQCKPDGEVDAEGLAARVHLIVAKAGAITNLNLESLPQVLALLVLIASLCEEADGHLSIAQTIQQLIGPGLDIGQGLFDEESRHAVLAERALKRLMVADLQSQSLALGGIVDLAGTKIIQHRNLLARGAHRLVQVVFLLSQLEESPLRLIYIRRPAFSQLQRAVRGLVFGFLDGDLRFVGSNLRSEVGDLTFQRC